MLYKPRSKSEWSCVSLVLIAAVTSISIFGHVSKSTKGYIADARESPSLGFEDSLWRILMAYASQIAFISLCFGSLYTIILAYSALSQRNLFQLIGLSVYNMWAVVYLSVFLARYTQAQLESPSLLSPTPTLFHLLISEMVVMLSVVILQGTTSWILAKQWSWQVLRLLDANADLQNNYRTYQMTATILNFDVFFFLGDILQFGIVLSGSYVKGIVFVWALCVLPTLFLCSYSVREEVLWTGITATVLMLLNLAGLIVKNVEIYWNLPYNDIYRNLPYNDTAYHLFTDTAMVWSSLAVACNIATIVLSVMCIMNFGRGLEPYLTASKRGRYLQRHHVADHQTMTGLRSQYDALANTQSETHSEAPLNEVHTRSEHNSIAVELVRVRPRSTV